MSHIYPQANTNYAACQLHFKNKNVTHTDSPRRIFEWVVYHIAMSPLTRTYMSVVCPRIGRSHVTHTNESRIWMRHGTLRMIRTTCINDSYRTYQSRLPYRTYAWAKSHIQMSHATHVNGSCHTCAWVMSHIWVGRVPLMNESCRKYERVLSLT